jgi:hypothetical protein
MIQSRTQLRRTRAGCCGKTSRRWLISGKLNELGSAVDTQSTTGHPEHVLLFVIRRADLDARGDATRPSLEVFKQIRQLLVLVQCPFLLRLHLWEQLFVLVEPPVALAPMAGTTKPLPGRGSVLTSLSVTPTPPLSPKDLPRSCASCARPRYDKSD